MLIQKRFLCLLVLFSTTALKAEERPNSQERWGKTITAFEESDRQSAPKTGQVLFIGSSSIRLWNLEKYFPELDALNRGFGGSEIEDSIFFFDRIVKPYVPRQIVMYAGDNDLAHGKTAVRVYEDFQKFVSLMNEHLPDTTLVYVAIKPSIKRWNIVHRVRAANALIKMDCVEDDKLVFLDIDSPMLDETGELKPELFVKDGLHLSHEGYTLWSSMLQPQLSEQTETTEEQIIKPDVLVRASSFCD